MQAAAMEFLIFSYKPESPFSGNVQFIIEEDETQVKNGKIVTVISGKGVQIFGPIPELEVHCVVELKNSFLLSLLMGGLDLTVALEQLQIKATHPEILYQFIQAFDLSAQKFDQFYTGLEESARLMDTQMNEINFQGTSQQMEEKRKLRAIIVEKGQHFISTVRELAAEMEKTISRLRNDEFFQKLAPKAALLSLKEQAVQEWKTEKIGESAEKMKQKLQEVSTQVVSYLVSSPPQTTNTGEGVTPNPQQEFNFKEQEREILQKKLTELKEKNALYEQDRLERKKLASSQKQSLSFPYLFSLTPNSDYSTSSLLQKK